MTRSYNRKVRVTKTLLNQVSHSSLFFFSCYSTTDKETTEEKCQVIQVVVIQHKAEVIQALLLQPQEVILDQLPQHQAVIQARLHVLQGDILVQHHPQEVILVQHHQDQQEDILVQLHLQVAIQVKLHFRLGDIQAQHHHKEDIQAMVLHNNHK